ncbi:precorrin-6y C5,15-methyltransferase (decarboxylating) subunit CbiE [Jiella sp. MQZ9-1]|uniref:Precorrin-6y C5,15-methyltransferase (Decarboxylating) subunit CbiE n=1 Tax=Jiella flava TaxID=2816857 RepID=A0A939JSE8_9HYPH|nr:precorrin-6y C5,15-methyltransferase (decarboxylating) subunit CbiE [Jiella flava]MBO0661010.1 precorrin-6y C5,15-methyltransferase (decarboxylating) subunit CbiE [Jiella flava]MCD2469658.1 precorrin-6y C5,15-methyltransferase (decarboxylating) subunit CbiE [Jiella flava]
MSDPVRPWLSGASGPSDDERAASSAAEPWLTIIGIGDAGLASLTGDALDALDAAKTIFGGERHLAMLGDTHAETFLWDKPFVDALDRLLQRAGTPTVVLATGDPMWFGVGATLARHIEAAEMRVLSAPSAFSLAAAKLGWPLQNAACLTVHGRPVDQLSRHLFPGERLLVLSADAASPREIARLLTSRGFGQSRLTVLEHLGGSKERRRETVAAGYDLTDEADLNIVAVDCVAGRAATPRPAVAGLPDDAFIHDGKMTKRMLRALAIAALEPMPGALLWDVGAGAGSVAVEWLRAAARMRAIAIELKPERAAMIAENASTLGVPELLIVEGRAPEALAGLDAPDAIFIGGGLSDGVFEAAWSALKPGGRMVAHAVTLESEAILIDLHARHGGELMRAQIDRAEKVGPFRGFKPAMPVIHWHVAKPYQKPQAKPEPVG